MPRGHYWEMCYNAAGENPAEKHHFLTEANLAIYENLLINEVGNLSKVTMRKNDITRRFVDCDFQVHVVDSDITNCEFSKCRFEGSRWENVKFSNCTFDQSDFSGGIFFKCAFLDSCKFQFISASPQKLRMDETAVSPSTFLSAISTNLKSEHVNSKGRKAYQVYRLFKTKEKLAKLIFQSTRSEPDMDYFFDAHKQLAVHCINEAIARKCYKVNENDKTAVLLKRRLVTALPSRVEKAIVIASGWLTNWGRSLLKPLIFFLFVVALFTMINASLAFFQSEGLSRLSIVETCSLVSRSLIQALEITLVAGYTAHVSSSDGIVVRLFNVANLLCGIYWYSLMMPVISRRTLR